MACTHMQAYHTACNETLCDACEHCRVGHYSLAMKFHDCLLCTLPICRQQRYDDCVNTAKSNGYTVPAGNKVFVITYPDCDFYGFTNGGSAYVDYTVTPGGLAHEGG